VTAALAGRTAVVVGGATGLGAAIAETLAGAGARGAVLDLARIESPPEGWRAITADVRDDAAFAAAFDDVGRALERIDVLVAAAAIVPPWGDTAGIDLAEWDEVMRVNVRGVASTFVNALPFVSDGASVIAIASVNAWKGDRTLISYTASKHAVLGIVRSAALDLGRRGIRVNAIAPGPVATEAMLGRMRRREETLGLPFEEALSAAASATALGRIATVEEIANTALFLASDLSSGITGQLLAVDGGIS
jgi:NAD(P)-dependent dehydrogenase (short-subunit alcohol dehydrogenase family)